MMKNSTSIHDDPVNAVVKAVKIPAHEKRTFPQMYKSVEVIYNDLTPSEREFTINYFKIKSEESNDFTSRAISFLSLIMSGMALLFSPFITGFSQEIYNNPNIYATAVVCLVLIVIFISAWISYYRSGHMKEVWHRGYVILSMVSKHALEEKKATEIAEKKTTKSQSINKDTADSSYKKNAGTE